MQTRANINKSKHFKEEPSQRVSEPVPMTALPLVGPSMDPHKELILKPTIEPAPPSAGEPPTKPEEDLHQSPLQQPMGTSPQLKGLGSVTPETLKDFLECNK